MAATVMAEKKVWGSGRSGWRPCANPLGDRTRFDASRTPAAALALSERLVAKLPPGMQGWMVFGGARP